jgi:hypothetical protein
MISGIASPAQAVVARTHHRAPKTAAPALAARSGTAIVPKKNRDPGGPAVKQPTRPGVRIYPPRWCVWGRAGSPTEAALERWSVQQAQRLRPAAGPPYSLDAFTGVLVSTMSPQRGQTNTCEMACSAGMRADLDQVISRPQASQTGPANCSIDRLSVSIERSPPGNTYDRLVRLLQN